MLLETMSIIITALTTYFVTKYATNKPRKLEIKQQQFNNVYLPLHKLIKFHSSDNMDKKTALICANTIKNILSENYELAFPQLHFLNNGFIAAIHLDKDYQKIFNKMAYQINLDYVLLKKSLGYPSESVFSIFMRMKTKDKFKSLLGWTIVIYVFCTPFIFTILGNYLISNSFFNPLLIYIVVFFLLLYLNFVVERIKD